MIEGQVSRYNDKILIEYDNNKYYDIRERVKIEQDKSDILYEIIVGETLRDVAFKLYGDARLYWILLEYNRLVNPYEFLATGTILRCPTFERIMMEVF